MLSNGKFLFLGLLLSGCAGSYHPINPQRLSYSATAEMDGVTMDYRYDILRTTGNKKYAKKETRKNIRLLAVKLTNETDRVINVSDDLEIFSGNRQIFLLEPADIKREIKQIAPLYLIWSLLWVVITKCDDGGDCSSTPLPVGPVIGVSNTLIASGANKKLMNDLTVYNIIGKKIQPGETAHGIIGIVAESGQPLTLRFKDKETDN